MLGFFRKIKVALALQVAYFDWGLIKLTIELKIVSVVLEYFVSQGGIITFRVDKFR